MCGEVRQQGPSKPYAEGHHLHPLGDGGPDEEANIIVVCPNHHADFDYGRIEVDPGSLEITHAYENDLNGRTLWVQDEHELDREHVRYHNQNHSTIS